MHPLWQVLQASAETSLKIPLEADVIIDALFGLGQSRPLDGAALELVLNSQGHPALKVALDLPSGLDPATGQTFGAPLHHVFQADASLAMVCLKPGLLMEKGRDVTGELWWCPAQGDSLPAWPDSSLQFLQAHALPPRPPSSHKGSWGQALVVGGASGMQGAAHLAGQAALAAGAGKTWLMPLDGLTDKSPLGGRPECLIWQNPSQLPDWVASEQGVVVAGCGAGAGWTSLLSQCLKQARRLVLDADALNLIAQSPALCKSLQARADRDLATVLTPHPLEAARLLKCQTAEVQADRIEHARRLSQVYRCVVVLKGAGTLIADPKGMVYLNLTGGPNLSVGGSGDVLAGWLGGLWAQLAEDAHPAQQTLWACAYSVWLHGRASDAQAHQRTLPGLELIEAMRACRDSAG